MSLVPKITRFTKLPDLLKHKQESEEKQKKGRQDRQEKDRPPFSIKDEVSLSPESLSEFKIQSPSNEPKKPKTQNENIGNNLDLKA